jgi:hypothetical protein
VKLHIFQSAQGDCLLLEGADGKHVLCDGGMKGSMTRHVRGELAQLRQQNKKLDFVYISHIDDDHITGVVQLLEDELEWRLFEFHQQNGDPIATPSVPRPPQIGGIWHNSFRAQIGASSRDVETMLASAAPSLLASSVPELVELGEEWQQIAVSIPHAIRVLRYASPELLGIPVNKLPGSNATPKLLMIRPNQTPFQVGGMTFTIAGPTRAELILLQRGWINFLRSVKGKQQIKDLKAEIKRKVDEFGNEAFDLRDWNGIPDFKGVTTPNIASLLFLVEEGGKKLLLTGDAQQDIILKGLQLAGLMPNGHLHVDVLKVPHHGSSNNMDANFAQKVSADHYVFCGNGMHTNPDREAIQQIYDSRLGPPNRRALAPQAQNRPFKFWFSTTSAAAPQGTDYRAVFADREQMVQQLVAQSQNRLTAQFNPGARVTLTI